MVEEQKQLPVPIAVAMEAHNAIVHLTSAYGALLKSVVEDGQRRVAMHESAMSAVQRQVLQPPAKPVLGAKDYYLLDAQSGEALDILAEKLGVARMNKDLSRKREMDEDLRERVKSKYTLPEWETKTIAKE